MKHYRFMKKHLGLSFSQYFTYRQSTAIQLLSDLIGVILQPLLMFFIYEVSNGLPGWTLYELIFFNATNTIALSIAGSTFMAVIWNIGWRIDNGRFDLMLLKPLKIIPQMLLSSINPWWIGDIASALVVLFYSIIVGGFNITLSGTLVYIYLILISGMIYYGLTASILALSFKYFKAHRLMELVWVINDLNKYPLTIYSGNIKFFLTFILPISIANFYPASFFLGKITDWTVIIGLTAICLVFGIIGTLMLKWGIKNYSSGGG